MLEKRFPAVLPQSFTSDGTVYGIITIADTRVFKVKQVVQLTANTLPNLDNIEVKQVIDKTHLMVGPKGGSIIAYTDVSAYTVAKSAAISANIQDRPSIAMDYHERANYEEEPTVADRVILVDELGDKYNDDNPLPVIAKIAGEVKPSICTIFNELIPAAGVETTVVLPANTAFFTLYVRTSKAIRLQYTLTPGQSNINFSTVMPGVRREINGIGLNIPTHLYFQLNSIDPGGTIVEVEAWSS